jgi:DNA replication licensing factor MCM2
MLSIFDEVALNAILVYYPAYERIHSKVHVHIADLPLSSSLRDLRHSNLNNLMRVSGIVTRRSGIFPQLKYVKFDCKKCGAVLGPFYQDATKEVRVSFCANCESKRPFQVNSEQASAHLIYKVTPTNDSFADSISELSEDDAPGISWVSSCWSFAWAS